MGESEIAAGPSELRKAVTVEASVDQAFGVFVERPIEWIPRAHAFGADPQAMSIEGWEGGRFYERDVDGREITRGTILEFSPPRRVVMTWRIGPNWQPVLDDEHASRIAIDFRPDGADLTEVVWTYTELDRHGDFARVVRAAIAGSDPGETVENYAAAVARHATA
jgi:uncharacterized protein YndB with AHSA1/START domain